MSDIKEYSDPKLFWKDISPYLKQEEAKNSMCLGLSFGFISEPENCSYQSAYFENSNFIGSLVVSKFRTHYNLLVNSLLNETAIAELFNTFLKREQPIHGVIGDMKTATLIKNLVESQGKKVKVLMRHGIYRCRKVKTPQADQSLTFRIAEPKDVKIVGQWSEEFHQEAVPHDPPVNGAEIARSKIESKMIYILEQNSVPVSMAAWSRDIGTSCSVNFVYTPKHLRKNGFASVVTAQITQHLLNEGKTETNLYTDMSNPTSNKIYMNVGYEFVCDSIHYGVT